MNTINYKQGLGPLVIIIIVAVVVAIGGGAYYLKSNSSLKAENNQHNENAETGDDLFTEGSNRTSIRTLLGLGRDITCTFHRADAQSDISGTVYIADGNMRGDFMMGAQATGDIESHMIHDGEYAYVWTSEVAQGTKMRIREGDTSMGAKSDNSVNIDDETDYECSGWSKDNSKFELPRGIEFMDVSAMLEQKTDAKGNMQVHQCGSCDLIPDAAAKAQCKAALGC